MHEPDEPTRAMKDAVSRAAANAPAPSLARGPVALEPVTVAKPWGTETWYSGIERRGESRVRLGEKTEPLSSFLARHGRSKPPLLLKRLVPRSGHLYLEVHRTKHEVYVVDRVDPAVWSDGCGEVLCGVDATVRAELGDEALRRAILNAASAAERRAASVAAVDGFMARHRLAVGDSVEVMPGVPHSLRQGVEVIEFQTPVYERLILAASQPVQTQNHWDSAAATDAMHLAPQPPPRPTNTEPRQTLATAHTFEVTRHIVAKGATLPLPAWCVGWTARGELRAPNTTFTARQAFLAPRPATLVAVETSEVLTARETA